jgi:hypothetical protein
MRDMFVVPALVFLVFRHCEAKRGRESTQKRITPPFVALREREISKPMTNLPQLPVTGEIGCANLRVIALTPETVLFPNESRML